MKNSTPEPLDWSWTTQCWLIAFEDTEGDKDEHIIRALTREEALHFFLTARTRYFFRYRWDEEDEITPHAIAETWKEMYQEIEHIFSLPTAPGLTGYVDWHGKNPHAVQSWSGLMEDMPPPPTTITLEDE